MTPPLATELAEGFQWIESHTNFERSQADSLRPFRLDRMRRMAEILGQPQNRYKSIHVAGSKGKGSVCAMTAAALQSAGLRTGLYGSPHVYSYRERFMLNGSYLPEKFLIESILTIRNSFSGFIFDDGSEPTTFELLTLTGMLAFSLAECQWVVFETGLGGRLDATNILAPEVTAITSIELEHTRILGSTRSEIAAEKGGIIKQGTPLVLGHLAAEAESVIEGIAAERRAPLFRADRLPVREESPATCSFSLSPYFELEVDAELGMPGLHQAQNARSAALCAALALASEERIEADPIRRGISMVKLPGRFEVRRIGQRECIFDAAHTASSVGAFTTTFRHLYPSGGVMILGVVAEKDLAGIAAALPSGISRVVVTRPGSFKSSDPQALHKEVERYYPKAELIEDPAQAWQRALETAAEKEPILILGSFYLPAAVSAGFAGRD